MKNIRLEKISSEPKGKLHISGSKSISNRVLIMLALSGEETDINDFSNLSEADDTQRMVFYLNLVSSCSNQNLPLVINAENAGTVMRFLASFLSVIKGDWLLTGSPRMQQRPIGILVSALQHLGAKIVFSDKTAYPPLRIKGGRISGGELEMDTSVSSQFITSLMMVAPYMDRGLTIRFSEKPVSFSYIEMTRGLMQIFGADVELEDTFVRIKPSEYQIRPIQIEPDWSSASYWYELVSLAENSDIFLEGFTKKSVQGDSCVSEIYNELGVQTIFEPDGIHLTSSGQHTSHFQYDFTDAPDLVPAVLTTCAAKKIKATVTGVEHLKHKESDRMLALTHELKKIGALITEKNNTFHLSFDEKVSIPEKLVFETYKDHRMAMCFAPLAIVFDKITIKDKDVVEKSYPAFWDDLQKLKFVRLNS
ncbi:MAG: 3-phosphoshikimate 1-carboxyvinyltransferase [Bacteroidetes bacterium]|nr:3-phosphoshikimate 1-carboxyvinyltransferase [Bacteroidota bacterium]